jgi:hypothetical protein
LGENISPTQHFKETLSATNALWGLFIHAEHLIYMLIFHFEWWGNMGNGKCCFFLL